MCPNTMLDPPGTLKAEHNRFWQGIFLIKILTLRLLGVDIRSCQIWLHS